MKRVGPPHVAIIVAGLLSGSAALAQQLPSAAPGATCSTPGAAATYGENGMLICTASLTWKTAIPASTPSNDGGLVSAASQRLGRAMAMVIDGAAQFVRDVLVPRSN